MKGMLFLSVLLVCQVGYSQDVFPLYSIGGELGKFYTAVDDFSETYSTNRSTVFNLFLSIRTPFKNKKFRIYANAQTTVVGLYRSWDIEGGGFKNFSINYLDIGGRFSLSAYKSLRLWLGLGPSIITVEDGFFRAFEDDFETKTKTIGAYLEVGIATKIEVDTEIGLNLKYTYGHINVYNNVGGFGAYLVVTYSPFDK